MLKPVKVNRFVFEEFKKQNTQKIDFLLVKLCKLQKGKESWKRRSFLHKYYYLYKIKKAIESLCNLGLIIADEYESDKYYLTELAQNILNPKLNGKQDFEKLLEWTYIVGDKQYYLYSWNDAKVSGLITVDAALMAGILFVLQLLDDSQRLQLSVFTLIVYGLSFVVLALSIVFCLFHTIPKLNSKMGTGSNLKTMIGINRYREIQNVLGGKNHFRAEKYYLECVKHLSNEELLEMNIYQIIGMNTNNIRSHAIIRKGVIATIISILLLILATIMFVVSNI